MNVTTHDLGLEVLDAITDLDALCLFVGEDERPLKGLSGYVDWRMSGGLSRVLKEKFFEGVTDDWLLIPTNGRFVIPRIFALGVGRSAKLDPEGTGKILASAAARLGKAGMGSVGIELPGGEGMDEAARVGVFRERFLAAFPGARVAVFGEKSLQKLVALR